MIYRMNMNTAEILDKLAQDLQDHPDDFCALTIDVQGYIEESERDFQKSFKPWWAAGSTPRCSQLPLCRGPRRRPALPALSGTHQPEEDPQRREQLVTMLLDAFSQLLVEG